MVLGAEYALLTHRGVKGSLAWPKSYATWWEYHCRSQNEELDKQPKYHKHPYLLVGSRSLRYFEKFAAESSFVIKSDGTT